MARPSWQKLFIFFFSLLLLSSCTTLRNYPANKPFVYETNIELQGKFSKEQQKQLLADLDQQLHDSIRVRSVDKLVGWKKGPRLFYSEVVDPAIYDSINADKSVEFMRALLNSQGYFRDTITYDTVLQVKGDQLRTTVNFNVAPGKLITLDSIRFNLENDTLQKVTEQNMEGTLLKKGVPFSKSLISQEFDRLVGVYRNNGYLRISFEDLVAVFDTVGTDLLRPTLDPVEQARQLQELQRRRQNPTASIEVRLRSSDDTTRLTRFFVGDVTVYPDLAADTTRFVPQVVESRGKQVISYRDLYKPHLVTENIYLNRGDLYSRRNYLRTLNRFNSIGSWRLVSIDQIPRNGTDTVDFTLKLTPAPKYQSNFNLEGSQNRGNPFVGAIGFGVNAGLNNRNFARGANQASTNVRYGVELGSRGNIQTQIFTVNNTIAFPRLLPAFGFVPARLKDNFRSILNAGFNYTDRFSFFNLTTFNFSWGYEFNWRNKLLSIRIPNIEYSLIKKRDSVLKLENAIGSYKYIFNAGLVTSTIINYTVTGGTKNVSNQKRLNFEISGMGLGFVRNAFLDKNLYRFIRMDAEFRQTHKIARSSFAWRVFGGAGLGLPRFEKDSINRYLPFFKQYFGGGPNSMRAWGLRRLGPGSNNKSTAQDVAPERFGDLQLEANAEYRFPLFNMGAALINGAFFTDMGNIWFLRKNKDFENGEFQLKRLWRDLAIGTGTGLRVDFGFLLVRLDYAYRLKDPALPRAETWFYNWKPLNGQLQIGVNYPF